MKTTSKFLHHVGMTSSVVASMLLIAAPASVFALSSTPSTTTTPKTSPFCTELPTKATTITNQLNTLSGKLNDAWTKQNQDLTTDWQNVDQKVAADRLKWDAERQTDFTKLMARAKTSSEQQAVQVYENTVLQAVNTRRAAFDSARTTFRQNVQGAVSTRQSTVKSQLTAFEDSVNGALDKAKASCASDPSQGSTIRQTLVSDLKTARETFQNDRKSDVTVTSQVKQYATDRDNAFNAATSVFQTNVQAARQTLQKAFGKTTV